MTEPDEAEIAYYRAVEDHFAALRGTPFLFSPKDFSLLRRWWREGAPLAAVLAGIGEAWERRRERDADPISSLSYCRHAVARQVKRLAESRVGTTAAETAPDVAGALASLVRRLDETAAAWAGEAPQVAAVLLDLGRALATIPPGTGAAAVEQLLSDLEFTTLDAALAALPPAHRESLSARVDGEVATLELADDVRERTRRALLVKELRRVIGLPRLELASDAG